MSDECTRRPLKEERVRAPEHRTPVELTDAVQGDGSSAADTTEGQPEPDALPPGQAETGAPARQAREDGVAKPTDGTSERAKRPVIDVTRNVADQRNLLEVGRSIMGMLDEMAANVYRGLVADDPGAQQRDHTCLADDAESSEDDWWEEWAAGKPLTFRGLKPLRQRRWH